MSKRVLVAAVFVASCSLVAAAESGKIVLPTAWRISAPAGPATTVGVMPQGIALSPDGTLLASIESGENPPALRILNANTLAQRRTVTLDGAFGKPVWLDESHVLVAGANTDALLNVDITTGNVTPLHTTAGTWPAAIALSADASTVALANDGDGSVTVGALASFATAKHVAVGAHPSDIAFSRDGKTVYVASRGENTVTAVNIASGTLTKIAVGLHPSALAPSTDGSKLYVAESDDDKIATIDLSSNERVADVDLGLHVGRLTGNGASPNAIIERNGTLFVSLGAENAVAIVHDGAVIERVPTGWYPTSIAIGTDNALYVSNGKGEGSQPNPEYNPFTGPTNPYTQHREGYIASIQYGSIRRIPFSVYAQENAPRETAEVIANAMPTWSAPPAAQTVIRPGGPIKHVIYIIKENRSYDQVLGDVPGADGDPSLVWFGRKVTPNQHAIAKRFGILDRAFTNSQVSADGHNWTDAAFANDYVERFWPPNYGNRRKLYDFQSGKSPDVPHNGYLWDAAARAGVTYRDYGEDIDVTGDPGEAAAFQQGFMPGLRDHFDPDYRGWSLDYSDGDRFLAWQREFDRYVSRDDLPQLEIVYLPNDHTGGTNPKYLTPAGMVAQNDWAVGKLVDRVSHSRYWSSTAIFALEDDAQNGPDHIGAQRSTMYVASPYAATGVHHDHYTTAGVVHTIEILLGMKPMSIYDQTALPLYAAFTTHPDSRPFVATKPAVDMLAKNTPRSYGARLSAKLDWKDPDKTNPAVLNDVIAHAVRNVSSLSAQGI